MVVPSRRPFVITRTSAVTPFTLTLGNSEEVVIDF